MRIWWCQEHECSGYETSCVMADWNDAEGLVENMPPCRMVPMRLIPDNAETVIRETILSFDEGNYMGPGAADTLIDLVLAALDGETP